MLALPRVLVGMVPSVVPTPALAHRPTVSAISRATAAILCRRGGGGGVLNPSIPPTAIVGRWRGGVPDTNRTVTRWGGSGYDILACWRGGVPDTNRTLTHQGGGGRTVAASMAFCQGGRGVRSPHSTRRF
jgi:hypothetical protein